MSLGESRSEDGKASESKVHNGTVTILVVDDDPAVRTLLVSFLERRGYRLLEANSAHSAVKIWETRGREIELVITDMVMPDGMGGRELASRLWQDNPNLRVIFTSGYSADVIGQDLGLREGVNFLQKPYHPHLLEQTIRDCLDRRAAT